VLALTALPLSVAALYGRGGKEQGRRMSVVAAQRQEMMWQIVRYGVNGSLVTALYSIVLATLDTATPLPLQVCNFAGYVVAVLVGYVLHSRVTFRNHGRRDRGSQARFVLASLPSFALNAFWVWLFTAALHWPHWTVYLPLWLVTPAMIFGLNRWWVFR
jgi:putative flippase GtrA